LGLGEKKSSEECFTLSPLWRTVLTLLCLDETTILLHCDQKKKTNPWFFSACQNYYSVQGTIIPFATF